MEIKLIMSTPQELIGETAKMCYSTKSLEEGGKDITSTLIHQHEHLSALRFAYATFEIKGISVPAHVHILRSGSHQDFMVRSLRYVDINKDGSHFVMPVGLTEEQEKLMQDQYDSSVKTYNKLRDLGVKKEDARAVLSTNISTSMNVTGNLQSFWDFFKLRLSLRAQTEVRAIATEMFKLLQEAYPLVFTDAMFKEWNKK